MTTLIKKARKKDKLDLTLECVSVAKEFKALLPEGQNPVPYVVAHKPELSDWKNKEKLYRFFEWGKPDETILANVKKLLTALKRNKKAKLKKAA